MIYSNFSQDLSDAYSAIHCLKNNISIPGHLLNKFDISTTDGLQNDTASKSFIDKIIDKVKVNWNLNISETNILLQENIKKLERIKLNTTSVRKKINTEKDKVELQLTKETAIQPLFFMDKKNDFKTLMELIDSTKKLDIKPIDIFNILKVDYENSEKRGSYGGLTNEAKNDIAKGADKIKNSNFIDARTMKSNLIKYSKSLGNSTLNANRKKDNYYDWNNGDSEVLIPICISNKEAMCILKDKLDKFIMLHAVNFSFKQEILNEKISEKQTWTIKEILEFISNLESLIEIVINKHKEAINSFKNLSADKIFINMYETEDEEVFMSIQYVLTNGYRNLMSTICDLCSSLNRLQDELFYLAK